MVKKKEIMGTENVDKDSNLTVYVKQSHKTCKLDPNK